MPPQAGPKHPTSQAVAHEPHRVFISNSPPAQLIGQTRVCLTSEPASSQRTFTYGIAGPMSNLHLLLRDTDRHDIEQQDLRQPVARGHHRASSISLVRSDPSDTTQ